MFNIKLQWKEFKVDLVALEAAVKALAPSCVGTSADSELTFWMTEDDESAREAILALWEEIDEEHEFVTGYTARAQKAAVTAQVADLKKFCDDLLVEFNTENIIMGISQEDKTDDVLEVMGPVLVAIQSVSPTSAIKRAKAIDPSNYDDKYVTAERLLKFVNKIEAKIGRPLSTEL